MCVFWSIEMIENKIEEMEDEIQVIHSQSYKIFIKMCACFTKQRVASFSSWFEMGCMLKNHFANKNKEKEKGHHATAPG